MKCNMYIEMKYLQNNFNIFLGSNLRQHINSRWRSSVGDRRTCSVCVCVCPVHTSICLYSSKYTNNKITRNSKDIQGKKKIYKYKKPYILKHTHTLTTSTQIYTRIRFYIDTLHPYTCSTTVNTG